MKNLLMDPAFPDMVGQSAALELSQLRPDLSACANDNGGALDPELADPFLTLVGKAEIAATRLW